ncbi:MAG TPA: AarF/UbiB family protein, partial [Polyangiales bacterium]
MREGLRATVSRAITLGRVGKAVLATKNAADDDARALARQRLASVLGDARGIAMKVGQLLASDRADDPLRPLIHSVAPLPLSVLQRDLEVALGKSPAAVFMELAESEAAASLGQVHRARLADGREVAVKVRYPNVRSAVGAELRLLGLVPGLGPARKWGFDVDAYKRVLGDNMERELDYRREAQAQRQFREEVRVEGLVVPELFPALCSEGLLVQSWETGIRLSDASRLSKPERLELGRTLLQTLFVSLFGAGLVHADPHPGNYLFRPRAGARAAEVVLLDFGCTVRVSQAARRALLHLITRTRDGGRIDYLASFAELGFDADKLAALEPSLGPLCTALFRPFIDDVAFRPSDWHLSEHVERACGDLKWWFRSAGPPDLFLLLRAFEGVCAQLRTLDVALPWWPILRHALGERALAAADAHVSRPLEARAALVHTRARLLKVRLFEGNDALLDVAFPAREALRLTEI